MITSLIMCALAGWCISIALCHHDAPKEYPADTKGIHVAFISCFGAGFAVCTALFHTTFTNYFEARLTAMLVTVVLISASGIGKKFEKYVGTILSMMIMGFSIGIFSN